MPDLMHAIQIAARPEKVYEALTTQKGLQGWWTMDTVAEPRVGSVAEFGFDRRGVVFRMHIDELTLATRVVWSCRGDHPEWTGTTLTWDLSPQDGGTSLRFRHGGWRDATWFMASCNATWGELMHRLRDYAEGKGSRPRWTE